MDQHTKLLKKLEEDLEIVKDSFKAEGKSFTNWYLVPYAPHHVTDMYILIAEADWLKGYDDMFEAANIVGHRIWKLINHQVPTIAYVLTEYNPFFILED